MKGSRMTTEIVILVVDDNQTNLQLLGEMLEMEGYGVRLASNGLEGLEVARSAHPSLILLDENMPGMDGVDVLNRLRSDERLRHVPIIALTAHAMAGDRTRYLAAGFNDYVAKPIVDEGVLLHSIERCFSS